MRTTDLIFATSFIGIWIGIILGEYFIDKILAAIIVIISVIIMFTTIGFMYLELKNKWKTNDTR